MPLSASLRINSISRDSASGSIEFNCTMNPGTPEEAQAGQVFASDDQIREFGDPLVAEGDLHRSMLRFYLAWWLARDINLGNENLVVGKTLNVDFGAVIPISRSV